MSTYLDNFQEMYTFIDRLLLNSTGLWSILIV